MDANFRTFAKSVGKEVALPQKRVSTLLQIFGLEPFRQKIVCLLLNIQELRLYLLRVIWLLAILLHQRASRGRGRQHQDNTSGTAREGCCAKVLQGTK